MSHERDDRTEIEELITAYARCFDSGDGVGWASLFTPDGTFVQVGVGEVTGPDSMAALVDARAVETPGIRHLTTNVSVTVEADGERARASAYALVLRIQPGEPVRLRNAGAYEDELVRVDGRWLFRRRVFTSWVDPEELDRPFAFA